MEYRTLGRTGLSVSAFALGTVELGLDYGIAAPDHAGRPELTEAIRLVHEAIDRGINFIDTARAYGESEEVLGHALQGRRDDVIIATKGSLHQRHADGSLGESYTGEELRKVVLESLHTSLKLLQTDHVDIWMVHLVDQSVLAQAETLRDIFDEIRQSGKVSWFGGSFYGVDDPMAALDTDLFDLYQVTYSVLDQRIADRFLAAAETNNIGVVARSVLLQGVLTERGDHLPAHLDPLRERSRAFRELVRNATVNLSPPQAAVAFALAQSKIQSVLIGVSNEAELLENLEAVAHQLPEPLLNQLAQLRLDDADLLNPSTW